MKIYIIEYHDFNDPTVSCTHNEAFRSKRTALDYAFAMAKESEQEWFECAALSVRYRIDDDGVTLSSIETNNELESYTIREIDLL